MDTVSPKGRFFDAEGIHNWRDYGGYSAADGARMRAGLLFRSGHHYDASEADLELFQSHNVQVVIDLRGTSERAGFPSRRHPQCAAQVLAFDGETASSPPHEGGGGAQEMSPSRAFERMIALYTRMPVNPAMIAMFQRYFRALAEGEGEAKGGSLVHCFAGKDRTGIAVALLMQALGAHYDDIAHEFLLTNDAPSRHILEAQSVPRMEAHYGPLDPQAVRNLLGVHPEYLATFWDTADKEHGSVDGYLTRVLGVDEALKQRLRARLLT